VRRSPPEPDPANLRHALSADLGAIGVAAGQGHEIDRLLAYARLLTRWNARIRLVGPSDLMTLVRQQLVDALGFSLALDALDAPAIWDIGAGGGLPGIPLALRYPERHFVLVEPIHKKSAFLNHAAHELGLANVVVHTGRLEPDGRLSPPLPRPLPLVPTAALSRATLAPKPWLASASQLLGPGGLVLLASAGPLPPLVNRDSASVEVGAWRYALPATGAPRLIVARRITRRGAS
jgi:16S rRNA (guanine(527)-N(7))-methyltransferase RsmG